jgi:4-hydroxybenzoate polyprenyltransferase
MHRTHTTDIIQDSDRTHWVNRAPLAVRPYLQLSRLDRPVGYWLLALPGWVGLTFASLPFGYGWSDIKWALLILIGAIAMRGAGCTYNDIVDQDLDKQVERTALRPLPAGTVSNQQAWVWLFTQCFIGLIILLCLPRLAQIISLCSIPLVAAYPFMKRITWWPQIWLGFTFNWAVLVGYAAKTGEVNLPLFLLYIGLVFWTVGYDTIYACQDIEDDAMVGIKSTARRFGRHIKRGVAFCFLISVVLILTAGALRPLGDVLWISMTRILSFIAIPVAFFASHLFWQAWRFKPEDGSLALRLFKSNFWAGLLLVFGFGAHIFIWLFLPL